METESVTIVKEILKQTEERVMYRVCVYQNGWYCVTLKRGLSEEKAMTLAKEANEFFKFNKSTCYAKVKHFDEPDQTFESA